MEIGIPAGRSLKSSPGIMVVWIKRVAAEMERDGQICLAFCRWNPQDLLMGYMLRGVRKG